LPHHHPAPSTCPPPSPQPQPRDHIVHSVTPLPYAKKAKATFIEFPLTGCTWNTPTNFSCPTGSDANPGFTSASNPDDWKAFEQGNSESFESRVAAGPYLY